MDGLFLDPFRRLLASLAPADPWPALQESGFLDLLRPEADGGAGLTLEAFFAHAFEAGRWPAGAQVAETMVARLLIPEAVAVENLEQALGGAGLDGDRARAVAAAVTAATMAGTSERLLEMTLAYAGIRRQFGREIGKFQAVQHQLAVMAQEVMAASMAAQTALVGAPLEISWRSAGAAKARAGQAAQAVSAIAHAVHGAIGVSAEHGLHLHTVRLRRARLAHGGETYWSRRLGAWVLSERADLVTLVRDL